jgi:hypothetical protein
MGCISNFCSELRNLRGLPVGTQGATLERSFNLSDCASARGMIGGFLVETQVCASVVGSRLSPSRARFCSIPVDTHFGGVTPRNLSKDEL